MATCSNYSDDSDEYVDIDGKDIIFQDGDVTVVRLPKRLTSRERLSRKLEAHLRYLYERQLLCDLVITNHHRQFHIHKVILGIQSENSDFDRDEIFIDISSHVLDQIIKFLYTRDITVTEENCTEILEFSAQFGVTVLAARCVETMKNFKANNALKFLSLAVKYNLEDLEKILMAYVKEDLRKIYGSRDFATLEVETVRKLLTESPRSDGFTELDVLKVAILWLEAQSSHNKELTAAEVLKCVDLGKIAAKDIAKYVEMNSALYVVPQVKEMLFFAYKEHAVKCSGQNLVDPAVDNDIAITLDTLHF